MSNWMPIPRRDLLLLVVILCASAVALLPVWRKGTWLGVSWLAWAMAILMVIAPLLSFYRGRQRRGEKG